jgi:hypothetical protein
MSRAVPLFAERDAWITPSIAVALLALLFTIGSFWWIQVRRGRLRCYTSHVYSGAFGADKLILVLPIVLHNPAPAPLAVIDLRLRIDGLRGRRGSDYTELPLNLRWIASHAAVYPKNETRTYAAPFAVDGRKATERFIEFQCDNPATLLEDGPYAATVEVLVAPSGWFTRQRWHKLVAYTFNTQLAGEARARLIPRSNDPDFRDQGKAG